MARLAILLVGLGLGLAACGGGDSSAGPDDGGTDGGDAGGSDAIGMPPAPALGAQLDRMGRPGVADALIGAFQPTVDAAALRDAYNQASDPATWKTTELRAGRTIEAELMENVAAFDALDLGVATSANQGCGNALAYGGGVTATSYQKLADALADDQIYVDTARATCTVALAVELFAYAGTSYATCGGRTPAFDAFGALYSALIAGGDGFDTQGTPRTRGSLTSHAGVSADTFPFLAAPIP